jgi:solute:Na+ symporter, SSS family
VLARGAHQERTVPIAKLGIVAGFAVTLLLAFYLGAGIVAVATALFFGMCASAFLPMFVAALFWPRATRSGVIAGMLVGLTVWAGWVLFFHEKEAVALGLCAALFGRPSLVSGSVWAVVDPLVLALPASSLVTVVACLLGRPDPAPPAARAA